MFIIIKSMLVEIIQQLKMKFSHAAKEAIDEIIRLITKLTNEAKFKNYWITADHGFIYKRDKLNESDKVDLI